MKDNYSTSPTLTFDQLAEGYAIWKSSGSLPEALLRYDSQHILIRGFLYPADNQIWILASEPNLKSCCVGNSLKKATQIAVNELTFESTSIKAYLVQGTLKISTEDKNHFYTLQEASILNEHFSPTTLLGAIFLLSCLLLLLKRTSRTV